MLDQAEKNDRLAGTANTTSQKIWFWPSLGQASSGKESPTVNLILFKVHLLCVLLVPKSKSELLISLYL